MKPVAMVLVALIGMPVPISDAAPLVRIGAWAPAEAPTPVESPTAPETVPLQRPTVEPPATAEGPATEPVDAASPEGEGGSAAVGAAPPTESTKTEDTTPEDTKTVQPEPDPAPSRSVATPWPEAPQSRPVEPPPPPGVGMRVGGGVLIGAGGLDVIVGVLGLIATNTADDEGVLDPAQTQLVRRVSTAQLVVGLVELGSGVGLVVAGLLRDRRLRAWESEHRVVAPKTGNGMIVGGSILLGLGVFDGITTGVIARETGEVPPLSVVITAAEVAAGAALLAVGLVRKKRYRDWERSNFATPSMSRLPTLSPLSSGMAVGVSGRF